MPVVHTKDKKGNSIDKLACSEFWKAKDSYRQLQDAFYKYMVENGFDLQRGLPKEETNRQHYSVEECKKITLKVMQKRIKNNAQFFSKLLTEILGNGIKIVERCNKNTFRINSRGEIHMLKKLFSIFIIITLLIGICGNVSATELKTTLDVIQQASETKYLENDQGYISKTIVDSNADTGEVTIELKLSNTAKEVEKTTDTEIFLVIDNSFSMDYAVTEQSTRRELLISAMRTFVNQIYAQSSNVKIGLVRFAGKDSWNSINSPTLTNGTNLMCNLTKDKSAMLSAITAFENLETKATATNNSHCEGSTNIAAGIKKANDNFSAECTNKIIVLLTDGLPSQDLTFSSSSSSAVICENTKNTLLQIGNSGTYVISMMTGTSDEDENVNAQEDIKSIFGTETNPTTGLFYNVSDANIEEVVRNKIFANVMEKIQNPINTTKILDYFPEDITDNFEFSYVGSPSTGTVSDTIDTESKTITWDIGTLKGDEVATLKYKLKIKDMKNTELLNKTIATNEKVVLTYKDTEAKDYIVTLTNSPKIQLRK